MTEREEAEALLEDLGHFLQNADHRVAFALVPRLEPFLLGGKTPEASALVWRCAHCGAIPGEPCMRPDRTPRGGCRPMHLSRACKVVGVAARTMMAIFRTTLRASTEPSEVLRDIRRTAVYEYFVEHAHRIKLPRHVEIKSHVLKRVHTRALRTAG